MPVVSVFTFLVVQPCFIPHTALEYKMIAPFAYHAKKANFSSFVNDVVGLEARSVSVLGSSDDPELRSGLDQFHEGRQLLVRDCDGVHLEELNEARAVTSFL